jgi:hypothetical protein
MADITSIVNELKQERDRIDAAIRALESAADGRRLGRPGRSAKPKRKGRRRLSAAARRRISEAAKARWAKAKRAGRNSL